jgi:uncharacterized lipoprotein YddW (UPF0748 family)
MDSRVSGRPSRLGLARRLSCLVVGAAVLFVPLAILRAAADAPIRAFWVSRAALDSPDTIRRALATAISDGFDTLMVPLAVGGGGTQAFDGAREMLKEARARSLRVHAWLEVNLVAAVGELPASRDHVVYQHPEWLMVSRELAPEVLTMDVRSPAYLGRVARWARLNSPRIDGLYISPLDPDAATYLAAEVSAALKRYEVDGVFLDAVRFPGADFDYSRHAMEIFRAETRAGLSLSERNRLEEVEAIDPFAYAEEFPDEWRQFRQARLTALMSRLKKAVAAVSPKLVVSAGVVLNPATTPTDSFQDWRTWMGTGLIDGIGRRNGTSGTIVFTADGLSAAALTLPANQPTAATGSR